jgi:hypothetical protein
VYDSCAWSCGVRASACGCRSGYAFNTLGWLGLGLSTVLLGIPAGILGYKRFPEKLWVSAGTAPVLSCMRCVRTALMAGAPLHDPTVVRKPHPPPSRLVERHSRRRPPPPSPIHPHTPTPQRTHTPTHPHTTTSPHLPPRRPLGFLQCNPPPRPPSPSPNAVSPFAFPTPCCSATQGPRFKDGVPIQRHRANYEQKDVEAGEEEGQRLLAAGDTPQAAGGDSEGKGSATPSKARLRARRGCVARACLLDDGAMRCCLFGVLVPATQSRCTFLRAVCPVSLIALGG